MEPEMLPKSAYVKCQFPGCSVTLAKPSGRRYCMGCSKKLEEAILANSHNSSTSPLPIEQSAATPQKELPGPSQGPKSVPSGGTPPLGPVRRGHRKLTEAAKRKFAGRARPEDGAENKKDE